MVTGSRPGADWLPNRRVLEEVHALHALHQIPRAPKMERLMYYRHFGGEVEQPQQWVSKLS